MTEELVRVARAFRMGGVGLGVPAAVALVVLGVGWLRLMMGLPRRESGAGTNVGLVGLLVGAARIVGSVLGGFLRASAWVVGWLAVAAAAVVVVGAGMYYTGVGLLELKTGARAAAGVMAGVVFLLAGLIAGSVQGGVGMQCSAPIFETGS